MFDDVPEDYQTLIAAIDQDLASACMMIASSHAEIAALNAQQRTLGQHPHYAIYRHGGIGAVRDMGTAHIFPQAGFYRLPHGVAVARLKQARETSGEDCLISALKLVCESDAMLEVAGHDWFEEQGLLKRGELKPFWLSDRSSALAILRACTVWPPKIPTRIAASIP